MSTDRTTEILNYLSAISREVGEMRTEIKELRAEMNTRFEQVDARFEQVDARFAEVHAQIKDVNTRLDRVERGQRLQGRRLARVEGLVSTTRTDVDELLDRVEVLEGKQT